MKKQIRHMPAHGVKSKEPEINDLPRGESRPPIIAAGHRSIAFECPDIGGERLPDEPVVLDQGVLDDLAGVVIDEFAADGVREDQRADQDKGESPSPFLMNSHPLAWRRRAP